MGAICVNGKWKSITNGGEYKPITWKTPACVPKSCVQDKEPKNATISYASETDAYTPSGDTAKLTCDRGYFFNDTNKRDHSITCTNGQWEEWTCNKGCGNGNLKNASISHASGTNLYTPSGKIEILT